MNHEPTEQTTLDPSQVVPYRRWSDPLIDNDLRLFPAPATEEDASSSLWTASLMSKPEQNWLAGLVQESEAPASTDSWLVGLLKDETQERRTWQSALEDKSDATEKEMAVGSSWLAGLVKDDKRPALNELARLLLGAEPCAITTDARGKNSLASPTQGPPQPAPSGGTEPTLAPGDPFSASAIADRGEQFSHWPPAPNEQPSEPVGLGQSDTGHQRPSPDASSSDTIGPRPQPVPAPRTVSPVTPPLAKPPANAPAQQPKSKAVPSKPPLGRRIPPRDKVTLYRALSTMFDAGVPLFAVFEFLAREGESRQVAEACRRIAQRLVSGISLSAAAQEEPELFDQKSVRMLEVGYRGGQLSSILQQLAGDEEHAWRTLQHLRTQLTYPFGIALLTLLAVVLMPPLVLNDLLQQVVALTAQPPALTMLLLNVSGVLASPWTWSALILLTLAATLWLRSPRGRTVQENLEVGLWFVPAVGPLWRNLVAMRFMRVFAMTYRAGLPALTGMELATAATGSRMAYTVYPLMKRTLLDGGTLKESFEAGGFLPTLALEAIAAGEAAGKVPTMLESASKILESEVQSRVDAVAKLVEPIVLAILGCVVGVFVLGCLLPIVELTANL